MQSNEASVTTAEPTHNSSKEGPAGSIDPSGICFFAGSSHPALAQAIAEHLGWRLDPTAKNYRFANDCLYIQLGSTMRGRNVFIVQSLVRPVDKHLMELLLMLDIARSAGARQIHAIIPYYSYARSDKKDAPRISITARLVADLLRTAGATHVMTMTLHSPQVHGFFSMPTDPLTARPLFVKYFSGLALDARRAVVVAPDIGHAKSASRFAKRLGLPMTAGDKTRIADDKVVVRLVGQQVRGFKQAIIYDDEIATGGSVVEVAKVLAENGIEEIWAACTHGVLAPGSDGKPCAWERLSGVPQIKEVVTTDTVPQAHEPGRLRKKVLSVAPIFGDAIKRNCLRQSIGDLFAFWDTED